MCDDIAAVNVRQSDVTHDVQMYERCLEDVARRLVHSVMEQKALTDRCQTYQMRLRRVEHLNEQLRQLLPSAARISPAPSPGLSPGGRPNRAAGQGSLPRAGHDQPVASTRERPPHTERRVQPPRSRSVPSSASVTSSKAHVTARSRLETAEVTSVSPCSSLLALADEFDEQYVLDPGSGGLVLVERGLVHNDVIDTQILASLEARMDSVLLKLRGNSRETDRASCYRNRDSNCSNQGNTAASGRQVANSASSLTFAYCPPHPQPIAIDSSTHMTSSSQSPQLQLSLPSSKARNRTQGIVQTSAFSLSTDVDTCTVLSPSWQYSHLSHVEHVDSTLIDTRSNLLTSPETADIYNVTDNSFTLTSFNVVKNTTLNDNCNNWDLDPNSGCEVNELTTTSLTLQQTYHRYSNDELNDVANDTNDVISDSSDSSDSSSGSVDSAMRCSRSSSSEINDLPADTVNKPRCLDDGYCSNTTFSAPGSGRWWHYEKVTKVTKVKTGSEERLNEDNLTPVTPVFAVQNNKHSRFFPSDDSLNQSRDTTINNSASDLTNSSAASASDLFLEHPIGRRCWSLTNLQEYRVDTRRWSLGTYLSQSSLISDWFELSRDK